MWSTHYKCFVFSGYITELSSKFFSLRFIIKQRELYKIMPYFSMFTETLKNYYSFVQLRIFLLGAFEFWDSIRCVRENRELGGTNAGEASFVLVPFKFLIHLQKRLRFYETRERKAVGVKTFRKVSGSWVGVPVSKWKWVWGRKAVYLHWSEKCTLWRTGESWRWVMNVS